MNKEQEIAYEWYKKQTSQYRLKADKDIEYKKMERRAITEGSFITFNYKFPKGKGKKSLRFYDEYPMDVILRIQGNDMWCINFHYIERVFRKSVIAYILKINKMRIQNDKRLSLTYQEMKEYIIRNSLQLCIKRYKVNRITNLKYVKLSEVKYIAEVPSERFIVQDSSMTEADLYAMIRSHALTTKSSKNVRFGRSTKAVNSRTTSTRTKRK